MKRTLRRLALVPLATALALVAPATASATVRCVNFSGGDCFTGLTYTSIQNAVDAAANGDTVRLKPQTYTESVNADSKTLTFDSPGAATINGLTNLPVLSMAHGGAVRGLTLKAGSKSGSGGTAQAGIRFASTGSYSLALSGVAVTGGLGSGGGTNGGPGLEVTNGGNAAFDTRVSIASSTIDAGGSSAAGGDGLVFAALGGRLSMSGATVHGPDAAGAANGLHVIGAADATVTGSLLQGEHGALVENSTFTGIRDRFVTDPSNSFGAGLDVLSADAGTAAAVPTSATVVDSLVEATPDGNLGNNAAYVSPGAATARLTARGSTFVARKVTTGDGALEVRASAGDAAGSATLTNSIVRGTDGESGSADLVANRATIAADHSSFSSSLASNGGASPAAGAGTNVSGDPGFASTASFALAPSSPLIDRGDPSVVTAGELDFAGSARALDGNGDCFAVPDIGAFERPAVAATRSCVAPAPPNAAPGVSGFGATNTVFAPVAKGGKITAATAARHKRKKKTVKRGTRFRYTLSEAAKVTITIEQRLTGRRVTKGKGKARKTVCSKPTKKNAKKRKCTRYKRAGTIRASGKAGKNTTSFTGRFKGRALKRGRYRATIVATDAQGAKSKPKRLNLRIVAP